MWKTLLNINPCKHSTTTVERCAAYALLTSSLFVLNLYLLLPKSILALPRNDSRQIKWRIFSVLTSVIISIVIYPYLFCQDEYDSQQKEVLDGGELLGTMLGFRGSTWIQTFLPLLHAIALYFGAICTLLLQHRAMYKLQKQNTKGDIRAYAKVCFHETITKTYNQFFTMSWTKSRDFLIAPFAEEVIFRSCIITPFLHSESYINGRLSLTAICWCTPLFFGIAHLHHALRQLQNYGNSHLKFILCSSVFQFLYTTIFGAYASFCYIQTRSLPGVVLLHSFCNLMGLPSMQIFFINVPEVRIFKILSFIAYVMGIYIFWSGFYSPLWLDHKE